MSTPSGATAADLLARWMPAQRWYPAKGRGVGVRLLGERVLAGTDDESARGGEVRIEVHVVGLDSGDRVDVVQVPVTVRTAPLPGGESALIGTFPGPDGATVWMYDGPHDQ
ncbi:MAG TPA: hypothetical protein PKB06_10605, partial [Actinotalea sp.]|nr:hypothetical protein [Actinotalea sp.]